MALLPNAGIQAFVSSAKNKIEYFLSGFAGYGWKIWEWMSGRYKLEIDDLTVRKTMTVYELIISKIRSIVGALAITQAHGKIKSVDSTSDQDNFLITLEDTNSFVKNDFIRMQEWTGGQRSYWVKVSEIRGETVVIPKAEFDNEISTPEVGDEIVQFGNQQDAARQSAIYLHADETGQPAVDVMFGIDSKSFDGKVKLRLGAGLPGVSDDFKGLYAENGMLKFTDNKGNVTSQIWPDGKAELGAGAMKVNTDRSGYVGGENGLSWHWDVTKNRFVCEFGSDAVLKWSNLSDDVKENLKGEPGKDGKDGANGTDGVPGTPGKDGVVYYTWIRYADDADGNGINNDPAGKIYMGLAYNKTTAVESNDPGDYDWIRFRGEDGTAGVPGPAGEKGVTLYTWIAYSDNADGGDMYQVPNENTKYIGIAVNKETARESSNPVDYTWSRFRGMDGNDGTNGEDGKDGQDANLLPWVEDWNSNATEIGNDFIVSPKMFSGTKDEETGLLTGLAMGRGVITMDGEKRTGIFGLKDGVITFEVDALDGTGSLACGNISWDEYGYLYQRSRPRILWRLLSREMNEAGIIANYSIDLRKGTYLDVDFAQNIGCTVILPDPSVAKNAIIDLRGMFGTRSSHRVYIICPGKLFLYINGQKIFAENGITCYNETFSGQYGYATITSEPYLSTDIWEWHAKGEVILGS